MIENRKPSSIPIHNALVLIFAVVSALIGTTASGVLAKPLGQVSDAEALFKEKCAACHTIGAGDLVGPDLRGVVDRRSNTWLTQWILAPDQVLASGDPTATELFNKYNQIPMPNLALTPDQVNALLTYLGSGVTAGGAALPTGDAVVGKALFVGNRRFANGGPQCMSCHSIAGIGALGGGNLGPDLTANGYAKYGEGLSSFLSAPPTVTMNAVWQATPLTVQEQADLYAFLKEASVSGRPTQALWQIAVLSIAGTVGLIALAQGYWGKRLRGVRRPMIERTFAATKK